MKRRHYEDRAHALEWDGITEEYLMSTLSRKHLFYVAQAIIKFAPHVQF